MHWSRLVVTGKARFADFADNIIADLTRISVRTEHNRAVGKALLQCVQERIRVSASGYGQLGHARVGLWSAR